MRWLPLRAWCGQPSNASVKLPLPAAAPWEVVGAAHCALVYYTRACRLAATCPLLPLSWPRSTECSPASVSRPNC